MIDPHVHCRDGGQSYKETIEHALLVAEKVCLSGIFDMPNPSSLRNLSYRNICDTFGVNLPELSKTSGFGLDKEYEVDIWQVKRR